jgi:hypothetical protein
MSTTPQELAVIEYMMKTRNLDRVEASNLLTRWVMHNWFDGKSDPTLKALIVAYKNTIRRGGRPAGSP